MYPLSGLVAANTLGKFYFTRNQKEFEAVICYYHVDKAARRVVELGYMTNNLLLVQVDPHAYNNGYYDNNTRMLTFGETGVDGAEDADIIWHEYAHAIRHNTGVGQMAGGSPTPVNLEAQSIQEGSADYWALSYKRSVFPNNWQKFADWSHHNEFKDSFRWRRGDLNLVYPNIPMIMICMISIYQAKYGVLHL